MESNELKAEPGIPVVRLSASSIQMFAEAHGFATDSVDTEAWKLIWEDVNYRIRQVANLAQKMQYHSRRRQLTTEHMNKAARIFKLQPSRGQEHWDAPKLHYIKELQIYARHEGNVDLVSLALAPVNQPKDAGFKLQVSEHVPKIEGLKLEDVKPEVKTDKDTNVDALIEMIVTGLVSQQNTGLFKSVTSFLLSEKSRNFVKPLLNFLMSQVQSPKCRPSFWLPILCKTVKLLVLNRDVERELGKFANSIGKLCLESIYLVPLDETWDGTFILDVGNTLNVLNRSYPKLVFCDSESICDHLMKILKDENFDPFLHSAALACLLNFDHAIFMQIGLVDLLKFHYEINKPVFESTNYFERNQQNNSIARAVYVGMWKKVVEKQIRNLSLICTHLAAFPSVNSTWLQLGNLSGLSKMLHDMYALAYEMFGSCFIVYDCNMVTNIPVTYCQNVGEQRTEGEEMVGIKKHLMDEIEEEAFTGSIRSLLGQETDEIMRETPPLTPKGKSMQATSATKRKPSSSSTGASKKRKRKTAEGAFESPRGSRFKMRRTDFIFVFHATEAKPSRGQEHWDAPKLHYIKELQIYARHEGNVDLVSLALAPVNQPKDAGFKLQVSEHVPKIEGLKLEDGKPEVKTDKDTNVDALIEMTVTGLVSQQNTGLFKVQSPKCRPSFWLPILCKTVKLLVLNRDVERELGKFANSIGKLCLESIYWVPLDETWDGTFILDVGNTLNVLNRSYPKLVFCDSESICDHLMKILKDENFDPFLHSAALACLLNFDHAIFMQIGLVDLLKFHYEINKPVFESTNYFERNQQNNSIARAVYVGMWKKVVEKQIRNLSFICTHLAAFPSENNPWLQLGNLSGLSKMLNDLYALAYEMFGSCFIVYNCNLVSNAPVTYCQNLGEQTTEGEEMVGIKKHLMDEIEEEAFTGSIRSSMGLETDEIMRETPPLTPKGKSMQATSATKRKPSSSSTGASKKRKRKTAEGAFESPRGSRFKMRRTDFIFVFHATEAKVLLSGPKPVTAVSDTPIDVAAWHNWLRQLRIGNKTGKFVIPKSSPNCFQAPLHLNSVIL